LNSVEFQPFDPDAEMEKFRRNLPHWRQNGVTYFITARLADSMPRSRIEQWKEERDLWLRGQGLDDACELHALPEARQREFQRTFTQIWHDWLDAGEGECVLREPVIAQLVADQLIKGHPAAYQLDAWVVMPNHLHAVVTPVMQDLSRIVQRWKGASARFINQRLGRSGTLWQEETFDHIVRSAEQLEHFRRYIQENPRKARLRPGEYLLGGGGDGGADFSPRVPE